VSSYSNDRPSSGISYNQPTIGICFDTGKIDPGKSGLKCWEILWWAVEPQRIAGSLLFEGRILESENVYFLAIQNNEAWRLEHVLETLEKDAGFLKVGASPRFYQGEHVFRQRIVGAGQVDLAGNIIGISYNARLALNKIKREKMTAVRADGIPCGIPPGTSKGVNTGTTTSPPITAPTQQK
jgi:hypothetical protein